MDCIGHPVGRLEPDDWIGKVVQVVVDRPLGSLHPRHRFPYELNYGYVPGTVAPDGEELDADVVGADTPLARCEGEVVAVVLRRDDDEDKLVVTLGGNWTAEQISEAVRFREQFFNSVVVLRRTERGQG